MPTYQRMSHTRLPPSNQIQRSARQWKASEYIGIQPGDGGPVQFIPMGEAQYSSLLLRTREANDMLRQAVRKLDYPYDHIADPRWRYRNDPDFVDTASGHANDDMLPFFIYYYQNGAIFASDGRAEYSVPVEQYMAMPGGDWEEMPMPAYLAPTERELPFSHQDTATERNLPTLVPAPLTPLHRQNAPTDSHEYIPVIKCKYLSSWHLRIIRVYLAERARNPHKDVSDSVIFPWLKQSNEADRQRILELLLWTDYLGI